MARKPSLLTLSLLAWLVFPATFSQGQPREDMIVRSSTVVLNEIMSVPLMAIPQSLLADAQGIAILPNLIKGGFVIGARHGRGVLLVRDENGSWHGPSFITLTGGSVGWQIGLQATDVILVFKTRQSVQGIMSGKLTIGADAAAAAGPVGRQAAAATDGRLKAEIYSYSRSRGLFAGVSIDGSVLQVDHLANAAYYRSSGSGQPAAVPQSALKLTEQVVMYCTVAQPQTTGFDSVQPASAQGPATTEADALRNQLAQIAPELYQRLDQQWQSYLTLPAEVFDGRSHPPAEMLSRSLKHFDTVARDSRYRSLAERPEFQSTYQLLQRYVSALPKNADSLQLPPPPVDAAANGN